jgi:hypothetical protein
MYFIFLVGLGVGGVVLWRPGESEETRYVGTNTYALFFPVIFLFFGESVVGLTCFNN